MAERGVQVDMVLGRAEGAYLSEVGQDLNLVDLQSHEVTLRLRALVAYLKRVRPDALLAAEDFANVAVLAKRLARCETNVVAGVHNNVSNLFHSQSGWKARARAFAFRKLLPLADYVVCVSQGVADDIAETARVPRERIRVIYNPLPLDFIHAQAKERVDHPYFTAGSPPVFVSVGRLTPQKDFANLIRAFAILRAKTQARLIVLGTGDLLSGLTDLARSLAVQDDVCFAGFVSNPYAYMARSAALVVSSVFEGLSTVLIEGLASGTQVVSTDCPSGPREILEDGKLGRLVPVSDPKTLADAMLDCVLHPMRHAGVSESLKRFRTERIVGQYLDVLAAPPRRAAGTGSRAPLLKEAS